MSEQPLDLKSSLHILRRRCAVVGLVAMLGLLAGAGYTALNPPAYTSSALVVLAGSTRSVPSQVVIASSGPVLTGALRSLNQAMSLQALRSRVRVTNPISYVLSISAEGDTAAEAKAIANAVAASDVAYVNAANNPDEQVQAQVLEGAADAAGGRPASRFLITAVLGALAGALIGAIGVLAAGRGNRRLRQREEIADAIGVPVLASLATHRPADAAGWASLLEDYEPGAADAWRLRSALDHLGLGDMGSANSSAGRSSLTVLSFSSDQRALALGPQLAVFTASAGIPTALVISAQQDTSTAALQAACLATPSLTLPSRLRVAIADRDDPDRPQAVLTVVVAVVDGRNPQVAGTMRANSTVLGVSAGAVTAGQLAHFAARAGSAGRRIAGILVADPDPTDPTTGRHPQLARPDQMPTRINGTPLVTRRLPANTVRRCFHA
jgi:capsular polysaccharide biosynthesis protein